MSNIEVNHECCGEVRVTCLVDNTSDLGSQLWGEHGTAFLIEVAGTKVLFDTGQSGDVLAHNLSKLKQDLLGLSCIVFSHGHYDHTGGVERILSMAGDVEVVAHTALFTERIARAERGPDRSIGIPFSHRHLESRCHLRLTDTPVEVAPGIFTSGQVPRDAGPEPLDRRLLVKNGEQWELDRVPDDLSLVVRTRKGLVLLLGCCHAGLINTLEHVRATFSEKVFAILGGTHLAHVDDAILSESVEAAKGRYGVQYAYVGHCSGARGLLAFAEAFGERGLPCQAGLSLSF